MSSWWTLGTEMHQLCVRREHASQLEHAGEDEPAALRAPRNTTHRSMVHTTPVMRSRYTQAAPYSREIPTFLVHYFLSPHNHEVLPCIPKS